MKKTYTNKKKFSQITMTVLTIIFTVTFLFSFLAKAESSWTTTTLHIANKPNQVFIKSYLKITDDTIHVIVLYKNILNSSTDVLYIHTNNSEWQTENMEMYNTTLGSGYKTAIDMDSQNHPNICYYNQRDGNLYYAFWDGSQWFITTIADFKGTLDRIFGQHCAMILNNSYIPHLFFYDQNTPFGLIYAYTDKDFINWNITALDTGSGVGLEPSVTIDHDNKVLISYFDHYHNDRSLRFAYYGQTTWIFHTVDFEGDVGHESSITVDKKNNPYISYFDKTNQNLKYAYSDGKNWSNQTIDTEGNVGSQSVIKIDNNNNPHIVYLNKTQENTIKYAYKDGLEWKFITISNGSNPLLMLDEEDGPHIVFESDGDIKYTRPDIWISSPVTNATFISDEAATVIWSSRQDISQIKIELLKKNNENTVGESKIINNTGLYIWRLSDTLQSGEYQLKISSVSNENMYSIKNIYIEKKSDSLANIGIIALIVVILLLSIVLITWFVMRRKK